MKIVLEITMSKFGPDVDIQPDEEVMSLSLKDHEDVVDEIIRSLQHYRVISEDQTGA
jgi:Tfp pilus assembly PilM family ATPase